MDYSTTLSSRSTSTRLIEILRQLLIMDEFKIDPLPEGGFRANRAFRSDVKSTLQWASRVTVTPTGREVVVEADFGVARWFRNFHVIIFLGLMVVLFVAISLDHETGHTSQRFIPFAVFLPLALIYIFIYPLMRRGARRAMDRLTKAAINISEIP